MADRALWQEDRDRPYADNPPSPTSITEWRSLLWRLFAWPTGLEGGATQGLWTIVWTANPYTSQVGNANYLGTSYDANNWVRSSSGNRTSFTLKSPDGFGGNGPYYLMVTLNGSSDGNFASCYMSKAAPTGGALNARQTATDECGWDYNYFYLAGSACRYGTGHRGKTHCLLSNEGDFVVLGNYDANSIIRTCFMMLAPLNVPAQFVWRIVTYNGRDDSDSHASNSRWLASQWKARNPLNNGVLADTNGVYVPIPAGISGTNVIFDAIPATGDWNSRQSPLMRPVFWMADPSYYGYFGSMPDMKLGTPNMHNKGFPAAQPYTGVQLGHLLFPFTSPLVF